MGKVSQTNSSTCTENYEKMYGFAKGEPGYTKGLQRAIKADRKIRRT